MNKEWFVLIDGYHKGPFSLKELEDMYRQKSLAPETMIWREGNASWSEIQKVMSGLEKARANAGLKSKKPTPTKTTRTDVPPSLPKDIAHLGPVKKPTPKTQEEDFNSRPPPIPLDALLNPSGKGDVFNESAQRQRALQAKYKLTFTILIILAFFGIATWFATHENKNNIQIKARGVMPIYVDRMQEAAQSPSSEAIISLALAMDGKSVYVAINKSEEMTAEMTLTPVNKRVMGISDVEIKITGEIIHHMGEFTKIKFVKGSQFFPGEYNVHFKAQVKSKLLKNAKFLENVGPLASLNKTIDIKTVALLYSGTPREFEKKIIEYHDKVTEEQLTPLYSKLESLKTMQSLLNKMMEDYVLDLYKIKNGSEIKNFEKKYIKEISPIVQSMMVEALESNKKLKEQTPSLEARDLYDFQERLVLFGKNIGELASDIITETQSTKKINDQSRTNLRNKFEQRYKVIKDALAQKVIEHEGKIENFKKKI